MRYYAMDTDVGTVRERNEDSIGVVERSNFLFLIVCDGMGGHEAGDVASQMAVEELQKYFSFDDDIEEGQEKSLLEEALLKANDRINYTSQNQGTEGMGATAVVALLVKEEDSYRLTIAYAGDSRAYIFAVGPSGDAKVLPLTKDHNVYNDATQPELVPENEREYLTQALGGGNAVQPTVTRSFAFPKDAVLLLCSDGLYEMLDPEEMIDIIAGKTVEQSVYNLIQEANVRQSHDNLSVVIFKHGEEQFLLPELAPEEASFEESETKQGNTSRKRERHSNPRKTPNEPKRNPPRNSSRNRQNRHSQQRSLNDGRRSLGGDKRSENRVEKGGEQGRNTRPQSEGKPTSKISSTTKVKTKTGKKPKKSSKKTERWVWIALILFIWVPVFILFFKGMIEDEEPPENPQNIPKQELEEIENKPKFPSNNSQPPSFEDKVEKEEEGKEMEAEKEVLIEPAKEEIVEEKEEDEDSDQQDTAEKKEKLEEPEPSKEEPASEGNQNEIEPSSE